MAGEKLGKFLKEVSNWTWDEFVQAEHDKSYTTNQAVIFALIRACSVEKMEAIRIALNRIDGKLKTPVKIEMPKIFYIFPHASLPEGQNSEQPVEKRLASQKGSDLGGLSLEGPISGEVLPPAVIEPEEEPDLPSMTLRETLSRMSDCPRELPEQIVDLAEKTDQWYRGHGPKPFEVPMVKSVVSAHLLIMAQRRNIDALTEVFDQIDGKLVETIQVLGDNIYITSYSTMAPEGAYLNADGVLEIEATTAQEIWAQKLRKE